jgi:hypothetical protein
MTVLTLITDSLLLLRRVLHQLRPASWAMTMLLSQSLSSWTYNVRPAQARKYLRDLKIDTQSNKLAKSQQQTAAQIVVLLLLRTPASLCKNKKLSQGGTLTWNQELGEGNVVSLWSMNLLLSHQDHTQLIDSHNSFLHNSRELKHQPTKSLLSSCSQLQKSEKGHHVIIWYFDSEPLHNNPCRQ